jgi:hypothetical protein
MFLQENRVAQAEFVAFETKFNHRPARGGVVITRPSIFERALTALRNALPKRQAPAAQPRRARNYVGGAPAK